MKRTFAIALVAIAMLITVSSCATMKGNSNGCKATKGFVGYGGGR